MRNDVERRRIGIPNTSVEVISVFRDGGEVNDAENRAVARPRIRIVRTWLTEIVEAGPYELSKVPLVIVRERKINVRDVGPFTGFKVVAG